MYGKPARARATPFGRWLTAERAGRNLSLRTLAERAGVSASYLSELERRRQPSRYMVEQLAQALTPDGAGDDTRAAILSAGMVAAGFGPSHELDSLPGEIRAVLVAHMDALTALDADSLRLVCEALEAVVRLAKQRE